MNLALGIVGLVAAIVILVTKIVELKLAIVKYRKESPTTTTATTTATIASASPKKKRSLRGLLQQLIDVFALIGSYLIVLGLFLSKGPVTKQDLGSIGIVVVFWFAISSFREKT